MVEIIIKIATKLVSKWKVLPSVVRWVIEQLAGWGITTAISNGLHALEHFLSHLASWIINKIASLLGL